MRTITLRKVPTEVMRRILERAREKDLSLAKAVVSLLEDRLGLNSQTQEHSHHDLDHLSGSWSKDEADDFSGFLAEQRSIDDESWK